MRSFICIVAIAASLCGTRTSAQPPQGDSPEALKSHVPVLDSVKAQYWQIDPKLGYAVRSVGGGVYVISDNRWQSAFLVTEEGVIVFDAPASYGKSIPSAIAKVSDKPIKMLVYSHAHKDHLGGSPAFKGVKDLEIVALDTVGDFLKEMDDPNRLLPNVTFKEKKTLKLGGKTVELTRHAYHSSEGDLFIYIPQAKFMMAIDSVTPGYAPFQGFDLTTNFHRYMKVFDELLTYDFDIFVGGHLTSIGTKHDIAITKEFTMDVYETVKRVHNKMDQGAVVTEAAKIIGTDNEFLLFKVLLDKATNDSVTQLSGYKSNRLNWLENGGSGSCGSCSLNA